MTARRPGAPMPDNLRTNTHPARQIPCPHCQAHPHQHCTTPTGRRLPGPHPARIAAWQQNGANA